MIPGSLKANSVQFDITHDKMNAGVMKVPQRILIIGSKNEGATITVNKQYEVGSADQVAKLAGEGSELHLMARYAQVGQNSFPVPVVVIANEAATATAAEGSIEFTGSGIENGTLIISIAGEKVVSSVIKKDSDANTIAAALVALKDAVDNNKELPVTAAVTANKITFTSKFKGATANLIKIAVEENAGLVETVTAMAGGTGSPDVKQQLDAVSESDTFTQLAHPYTDDINLQKIEEWEAARWAPAVKKGFVAFACISGTVNEALNLTKTRNSFVSCITGIQDSKTYPAAAAASIATNVALSAGNDAAKQLHGIKLHGVDLPSALGEWAYGDRDKAVKAGCSTINTKGGAVRIDQLVNTYQETATGGVAPDIDRKICTVNVLIFVQFDQDQLFTSYADAKLYPDGVYMPPNMKIMSPDLCRNLLLNRYKVYQQLGLVTGFEQYKQTLFVEIDPTNLERLNVKQELGVVGNNRITAITTGFDFAKGVE